MEVVGTRGAEGEIFGRGKREQEAGLSLETIRAMGLVGWIHMPISTTFIERELAREIYALQLHGRGD